jgi:hypothetical protein
MSRKLVVLSQLDALFFKPTDAQHASQSLSLVQILHGDAPQRKLEFMS